MSPASLPPDATSHRSHAARRTLAVLVDHVDHLCEGYEIQLRRAFESACQRRDLNLLVVIGRALDHPDPREAVHNRVYRLVHSNSVDGVIFVSGCIATQCGAVDFRKFVDDYLELPRCSLGVEVPGSPSIVSDDAPGLDQAIEHLIVHHGCREIGFIAGPGKNPDAEARLEVYRKVLERHHLPFCPERVAQGEFTISSGSAAAAELLDRRVELDALVAANDGMALGAISHLAERGVHVPRDLRVVGFDDVVLARVASPPLTTVRQPLERMAELAVDLVVDQIHGREVPICTRQPVTFVARESCGCGPSHLHAAPSVPGVAKRPPLDVLCEHGEALAKAIKAQVETQAGRSLGTPGDLVLALQSDLEGHGGAFLDLLAQRIAEAGDDLESLNTLQTAVTALKDALDGLGSSHLSPLWQAALRDIASAAARCNARQRLGVEATYQLLLRSSERLSTAENLDSLKRALLEELPSLQITEASVGLFADDPPDSLVPFFCMSDGALCEPAVSKFPAEEFLTRLALPAHRRTTAFVLPLTFESEHLGVAVFVRGSAMGVYEMLRGQISIGVKNVALRDDVAHTTALHERLVQERIAATSRMDSLSALAGGVAHDLNSALAPLVTLPDLILRDLDELGIRAAGAGARVRSHIATLKNAGLRSTRTIGDLMTLGRQGRTAKTLIELNRTVASCLASEPALVVDQNRDRLEVALKIHPTPLYVEASQHHVDRAIANLIRNATEAIDGPGQISIVTSLVAVDEPLVRYETVLPGRYAAIEVSDTGRGIPTDQIGHIFEPFFSKKRLQASTGSGLGLSIVHGVVKEHGGFVDVASICGHKTTFTLYFPLAVASEGGGRSPSSPAPSGGPDSEPDAAAAPFGRESPTGARPAAPDSDDPPTRRPDWMRSA